MKDFVGIYVYEIKAEPVNPYKKYHSLSSFLKQKCQRFDVDPQVSLLARVFRFCYTLLSQIDLYI